MILLKIIGGINMYEESTFISKSGTRIHYYIFKPIICVRYKAVLQIHHGMAEHALRYQHFCEYLCRHDYVVVVSDHLGHGQSLINNQLGFFGKENGWNILVEDVQQLNRILYHQFPDIPHFLFGHSMGSFVARDYASQYGEYINGLILSGTGINDKMLSMSKLLIKSMMLVKGRLYRSKLIDSISFGQYNERFKPNRTNFDWLSRDEAMVDAYINDSLCGYIFTLNAYYDLLSGFTRLKASGNVLKIPKDLPILFVSGSEDPVGHFGKDIEQLSKQYRKANIKNVEVKLYKEARHEVLNDSHRIEVYKDILSWMEKQIGY